jgi:thiol-disulfide isomerase/thioredoxin
MKVGLRLRSACAGLARGWKRHLGTAALMFAVVLAVQAWQTRDVAGGPLPAAALDAPLPLLDAQGAVRESSLRAELATLQRAHPGQNVGLYVWAEWCPICKTIQGTVDGLSADHPVITVAMQSGPPDKVARYLGARGLAWPTLVDPRSQLSRALGFGSVPAFAVITPQGELRWPTVGLTSGWGMRLRLWLAR